MTKEEIKEAWQKHVQDWDEVEMRMERGSSSPQVSMVEAKLGVVFDGIVTILQTMAYEESE